jgi:hypothetical protein
VFAGKHGENGKDAGRSAGENLMKRAEKKTNLRKCGLSKTMTTKVWLFFYER